MEKLEHIAESVAEWIGSPISIIVHTGLFIATFLLPLIGMQFTTVLIVLTTIVSLEAIYLSIFIQISVNKHTRHLKKQSKHINHIEEKLLVNKKKK